MSLTRALMGVAALSAATAVSAFDLTRDDNIIAYYGQNSVGASGGGPDTYQKSIGAYCDDDSVDMFPLSFLTVFFSTGGYPEINMANTCNGNDNKVFNGTALPDCSFLEADIKKCQAAGKAITLSMGGATGGNAFADDDTAKKFADQIWNVFLGGTDQFRPFGKTPLDGVDLDIEGGSSAGYAAFITQLRTHFTGASKNYYVTGAPQCPFPDAYLGDALNSAYFDAVNIQFYNNYCGVTNFNNTNAWNWASWETWAETQSPNKNVKLFIGAPAATGAANAGSYVDPATLGNIATTTRSSSKHFGGVMYWDISQAVNNNNFHVAIKAAIKNGSEPSSPPPTSAPAPPPTSSAPAPPPTSSAPAPPPTSSAPAPPTTPTAIPGGGGESGSTSTEDPCPPEEPTSTEAPPPPPTSTEDPCPPETSSAAPPPPTSTEDPCPPEETTPPAATSAPPTSGSGTSGGGCSGAKAFDKTAVYTAGMMATSGGKTYKANWWTQGGDPASDTSGAWSAATCFARREAAPEPRITPMARYNPHGAR